MTYPLLPGAPVDLTFETPAHSAGPGAVNLTFGATAGTPPDTTYEATFNAKFTLRGTVTVDYDSAQWRGLRADTVLVHQPAKAQGRDTQAAWVPSRECRETAGVVFGVAHRAHTDTSAAWSAPAITARSTRPRWGAAAKSTASDASSGWFLAQDTRQASEIAWGQDAWSVGASTGARFGLAKATPLTTRSPWQEATAVQRAVTSRLHQAAKALRPGRAAPWQGARVVASYGGPRYLPPPRPAQPPSPMVDVPLQFCALYAADGRTTLIFGRNPCAGLFPDAPLYILPARFYMAVHQIEAHLLPSLTPIPIFDVSLSADSGSFAWTFSASGPASLFDDLAPTGGLPPSIRITLDGMQWVFVVDSLQRQEQFGKGSTRISGRSATALVGQPYARETARLNTTARNAQQLAASALDLTGAALDWGIDDWLVPAGAWSQTGTPLAAVQAIAEAAGGYVNSHRSAPTLLVRHPYPTLPGGVPGGPWNWSSVSAVDVELAPSAIITSSIDRRDGPDVDGIYVSGTAQGVLAHVKRMGTAGAKLAGMVTESLITANVAAQQRGLAVLGAAGAKHLVQISLPVLTGGANPGVLDVGQLVQINDATPWRGMVRSVGVQASQPKVRQTITLERHL